MQELSIRECTTIEEFHNCVYLQREAFGLPDLEISPRRHLIVSRHAGGWTLGAFAGERMVGFVHHLVAVKDNALFGYSHMMAVAKDYQNHGVGAKLKWAQRAKAMTEDRRFIKWTWDPMQSRNAHFNLNRLGVVVDTYADNFYGTDYDADPTQDPEDRPGLQSDRLFASWHLASPRVVALSEGKSQTIDATAAVRIAIPADWSSFIVRDVHDARATQARVRQEFKDAFAAGLVCAGFQRGNEWSEYLLYHQREIE